MIAGSANLHGTVLVLVERTGAATRHGQIVALMERASVQKPQAARVADRFAAPFLACVLLAAVAAAWWWWPSGPGHALGVAVAVLIVTCPCALSLATPAATLAAGYERAGGAELVDWERHLALAALKIAVIAAGIDHRRRAGAGSGPGFDTAGEAVGPFLELARDHLRSAS